MRAYNNSSSVLVAVGVMSSRSHDGTELTRGNLKSCRNKWKSCENICQIKMCIFAAKSLFLVVFVVTGNVQYTFEIQKCCADDQSIRRNNSGYFCTEDEDKRVQVFAQFVGNQNSSNVFVENICYDVENRNVTEYKLLNQTIVEDSKIDVNFYPKCCPLGYIYHSRIHACRRSQMVDHRFITQHFVRVGLPDCKLVVDFRLNSSDDFNLEMNTLYLAKYNKKFAQGSFCMDKDEDTNFVARGCYDDSRICEEVKCIHKCCADGQSFINGSKCVNTYENGVDLNFSRRINSSQDPFAVIHKYDCRIYLLDERKYDFQLGSNGVFWAFYNKTGTYKSYPVDGQSYCIEHVKKGKLNGFRFFMCFEDTPVATKFLVTRWVKILSCIFVTLTIMVYLMIPELMNLFGRILLCYCSSILALFMLLTYMQFKPNQSDQLCVIFSFISLLTSLWSFSWLNVMCFDIWYTFGSPKTFFTTQQKIKEFKRFILYSLYGWSVPVLLTLITFIAYMIDITPAIIRPYIGRYKCYLERRPGNHAMLLFYVTPLTISEVCNLILFMKTITYCLRVKNEINRMNENRMSMKERRRNFDADKERLELILKLSVIMGISFIFEAVSSMFDFGLNPITEYVEIVWDTVNGLQGVFIFIIFVCKKKVMRLFHTRICGERKRKSSTSSIATAQISVNLNSKNKIGNV